MKQKYILNGVIFPNFFLKEWRRKVGQTLKPKYKRYVELKNKRAVLNGYNDYGDQWRQKYDTLTFEAQCLKITQNVEFDFFVTLSTNFCPIKTDLSGNTV